jgi:hypothetical protein
MDQIIIGDQYIKVYFCQQVNADLDLSREQTAILCCLDIVEFPRQGFLLEKAVTVYRRYGNIRSRATALHFFCCRSAA